MCATVWARRSVCRFRSRIDRSYKIKMCSCCSCCSDRLRLNCLNWRCGTAHERRSEINLKTFSHATGWHNDILFVVICVYTYIITLIQYNECPRGERRSEDIFFARFFCLYYRVVSYEMNSPNDAIMIRINYNIIIIIVSGKWPIVLTQYTRFSGKFVYKIPTGGNSVGGFDESGRMPS